jgi:hypothetical protein
LVETVADSSVRVEVMYSNSLRGGVELMQESGYYSDPFAFLETDACRVAPDLRESIGIDKIQGWARAIYAPTLFEK